MIGIFFAKRYYVNKINPLATIDIVNKYQSILGFGVFQTHNTRIAIMNSKIICAWCGEKIADTNNDMGKDSHGICVRCYEKAMKELRDIEKVNSMPEKMAKTTTKDMN